jgi:hypothetical protein
MKRLTYIFEFLGLLLFAGCASVPMGSLEDDIKAKSFIPLAGKASLYIYRNENFGGAIPMTVAVNGKTLGQTAAMTFFRLDVPSGKYNVESHAENVSTLSLDAEAGKNYYIWQEVKMGMWMARSLLQQVSEATGREAVRQCKLIASSLKSDEMQPSEPSITIPAQPGDSISLRLRELEAMRKDGLITEEEYRSKRSQLLEKL